MWSLSSVLELVAEAQRTGGKSKESRLARAKGFGQRARQLAVGEK